MLNAASLLRHAALSHPERTAIVFEDERLSYAGLADTVGRVAAGLRAAGLGAGDHVALCSPNRPEFIIVYYAVLTIGGTVVTVSPLSTAREIAYYLDDSDADALICFAGDDGELGRRAAEAYALTGHCRRLWLFGDGDRPPAAEAFETLLAGAATGVEPAVTPAEQTAVILYTSGTTGQPKGAELTHANIVMNVLTVAAVYPARRAQVQLVALPLFHVYAQTSLMHQGVHVGDTLVLMQRFEPGAAIRMLVDQGVTRFGGVPTMFHAMLDHADFDRIAGRHLAKTLEFAGTGGAPMPQAVADDFEARTGVPLREGYGCTETSPVVVLQPPDAPVRPGSVGKAVWGVEVRIVDVDADGAALPVGEVGEIAVKGHCVMKGYYKRPEATAEAIRDGWYHTGDLGRLDADGYLYIVGRIKELIIRGGFNVYPAEVEDVLTTHPEVSLCAVVGVADARYGEEVKAFVVPVEGAKLTAEAVVAWARQNMAAHKYPRLVEIRDTLPLTATGKILKRELR